MQQYGWPKQLVTKKEKESKDWIKMNMDYFSAVAFSQYKQNRDYRKDYKLFNGEFDFNDYVQEETYNDILNYLNEAPNMPSDTPQHLQHYSIVNPPINTLLGEFIKRPYKVRVEALDEESVKEKVDFRTELLKNYVMENLKTKVEGRSPEEAQQITEQEMSGRILNYTTLAEHWGNKILEALRSHFDFKNTSTLAFKDFLITGRQFHHFYPDNSKVGLSYKVENPSNVWFLAQRNAFTTKDCWAIGTIEVLTLGEIISRYELTGEEIEHLTDTSLQTLRSNEYGILSTSLPSPQDPLWSNTFEAYGDFSNQDAIYPNTYAFNSQYSYTTVVAYWESRRLIYKRTYTDDQGKQQTDFVSEDYKICKECGDSKLEKVWINQWYRGLKVGADIYYVAPIDFCNQAPIVGLINTARNTQGKSPLQLLKPFQILYNIAINQIRELLEKEIGVVFLADLKVVPKDGSSDPIEQMLWNAKERGTMIIDTSIENTGTPVSFNQFTAVDLSRNNELKMRIELARAVKEEAWEFIGITRQRLGSVAASESATGTNTAIAQSHSQTEPWFMAHDNILREVYQTLLDIVQFIELKKPESTLTYLNDDLETVFLQITQDELLRDLWVKVRSFSEDKDMLETLKQLAQPAMQNGAELSEIADIFAANSQRSLRDILDKIQKRKEAQLESQQQLEQQKIDQQSQQFQMAMENEERIRKDEQTNDNMNKQLDRENKLQIEELRGISNESSYDPDVDLTDKLIEYTKMAQETSKSNYEKTITERQLSQKDRELDLKNKDIETKLKIAKENKTKAEMQRRKNKK